MSKAETISCNNFIVQSITHFNKSSRFFSFIWFENITFYRGLFIQKMSFIYFWNTFYLWYNKNRVEKERPYNYFVKMLYDIWQSFYFKHDNPLLLKSIWLLKRFRLLNWVCMLILVQILISVLILKNHITFMVFTITLVRMFISQVNKHEVERGSVGYFTSTLEKPQLL